MRRARCGLVLGILAIATALPVPGQPRYIDGIFVATPGGPVELIAYAEMTSRGQLRLQHATLEDAPVVHELVRVLCSLPLWQPVAILITTDRIFREDDAERRTLSFAGRKLNVYASELRVVDLERRDKIDALLTSVEASAASPGYAFVVLRTEGGVTRYYPFRLTPAEI